MQIERLLPRLVELTELTELTECVNDGIKAPTFGGVSELIRLGAIKLACFQMKVPGGGWSASRCR